MDNVNTGVTLLKLIESFGAPLAILAAVFFLIYKTVPKLLSKFLEDYKTMNDNFIELVKTSTQATTESLATFKSVKDENKESFQRIHDRLLSLADKDNLERLHKRMDELADKDNLERLHVQLDKIENLLINVIGGINND